MSCLPQYLLAMLQCLPASWILMVGLHSKRLAVYSVSFLSSLKAAVTGSSFRCFLLQGDAALEAAGQQIYLLHVCTFVNV